MSILPSRPLAEIIVALLTRSRRIGAWLLLAFAFPAGVDAAADDTANRVVYINSYHRGYAWSDGIEQGLRDGLAASDRSIELSVEYLDSRRFAYGAQIKPLAQSMAVKYAAYRPELVVVSDNAAFDFVVRFRDRLFPQVPIVFCGYNNFRPEVLKGVGNATGINEEIDIDGTVRLALKLHPKTSTLAFITSTGDASSKRIWEIAEQTVFPRLREHFELVILKDQTIAEIREKLLALPRETVLFLGGQISDQGGGRALTPMENARLITAASPFPAYTFWDFHLGHGVVGGQIVTGPEQGRSAAALALQVLAGKPAGEIPVLMTTPTTDIFDYRVLQRFGISPDELPAKARLINQPQTLWTKYRAPILAITGLLLVESVLIGLLLHVARARRSALRQLYRERETLEQRVAERTAELERVNKKLAEQSLQDSLTGLANRRRFDQTLAAEFQRLHRSAMQLSLIMLDIDYFKDFNDSYGHIAGDNCLRQIGQLLGTMVNRAPDLAARYGGEEFGLILPETDGDGARLLAERIRRAIEDLAIAHAAAPATGRVTASLGVVTVDAATLSAAQDIVHLADRQLYRAKALGRNRVSVHS